MTILLSATIFPSKFYESPQDIRHFPSNSSKKATMILPQKNWRGNIKWEGSVRAVLKKDVSAD